MVKLQQYMRDVPDLHLVSVGGSSEGKTAAIIALNKPLPLVSVLKGMSPVKAVVKDGKKVLVTLEARQPASLSGTQRCLISAGLI